MPLTDQDLLAIDGRIAARLRDLQLQREDFGRLEHALTRLAEAQASLEAAVARLTAGQAKLEEGQARLEAAVARLTDGQSKLEAAVARLTEGQARLTEGQAQLFSGLEALRREVSALSQNVGFGLEELAATFLPSFLEKRDGIQVTALSRAFVPEGAPDPEEVDLVGTARRGTEALSIVVECKARVYAAEVTRFQAKLRRLAPHLPHEIYPVMVAYVVHPSAQRAAGDVRFVTSHQL